MTYLAPFRSLVFVGCFAALLVACGDSSSPSTDSGADIAVSDGSPDTTVDGPAGDTATPDTMPDLPTGPSAAIILARGVADGPTTIGVTGAAVTYLKPAVGNDPAGFFIQIEQTGPALLIAVDPATLTPAPQVGDQVDFTITEMDTREGRREATMISSFSVSTPGGANPISALAQDVSAATDLVSGLDNYESELITVSGTVAGPFGGAGSEHSAAPIDTAGITGAADLRLRIPDAVLATLNLSNGCAFTVTNTPMWRFTGTAQVSAWVAGDISVGTCPAPKVVSATALSPTSVRVTFDRAIEPTSVNANGDQFTFDNGLVASAATVSGTEVTVTTGSQTSATVYTVTVAGSVQDLTGAGVDSAANTAMFNGFTAPAVLRINEVNANIADSCDLIELRVVTGGSMNNIILRNRTTDLVTFPDFVVQTNDYIVVHLDSNDTDCNPTGPGDETAGPSEFPNSAHAMNFDTAYDFYASQSGIPSTTAAIHLIDPTGAITEAVFLRDMNSSSAAGSTVTAAIAIGNATQWEMVGGGVPAGNYDATNFITHARDDMKGSDTTPAGMSIQRKDDADTNTLSDWNNNTDAATWGANNPGQVNF